MVFAFLARRGRYAHTPPNCNARRPTIPKTSAHPIPHPILALSVGGWRGGQNPCFGGQKSREKPRKRPFPGRASWGGLAGDPQKHQKVREPSQRLGRKVPKNTLFRGLSTPPKPPEKPQKRGFSAYFALIFHAKMTPRAHPPHRGDFPGTESPELGVWVGGDGWQKSWWVGIVTMVFVRILG